MQGNEIWFWYLNPMIEVIYATCFLLLWLRARENRAILDLSVGYALSVLGFMAFQALPGVPQPAILAIFVQLRRFGLLLQKTQLRELRISGTNSVLVKVRLWTAGQGRARRLTRQHERKAHFRFDPHRRFWQPGNPADRAPGARSGRLF